MGCHFPLQVNYLLCIITLLNILLGTFSIYSQILPKGCYYTHYTNEKIVHRYKYLAKVIHLVLELELEHRCV